MEEEGGQEGGTEEGIWRFSARLGNKRGIFFPARELLFRAKEDLLLLPRVLDGIANIHLARVSLSTDAWTNTIARKSRGRCLHGLHRMDEEYADLQGDSILQYGRVHA